MEFSNFYEFLLHMLVFFCCVNLLLVYVTVFLKKQMITKYWWTQINDPQLYIQLNCMNLLIQKIEFYVFHLNRIETDDLLICYFGI